MEKDELHQLIGRVEAKLDRVSMGKHNPPNRNDEHQG